MAFSGGSALLGFALSAWILRHTPGDQPDCLILSDAAPLTGGVALSAEIAWRLTRCPWPLWCVLLGC